MSSAASSSACSGSCSRSPWPTGKRAGDGSSLIYRHLPAVAVWRQGGGRRAPDLTDRRILVGEEIDVAGRGGLAGIDQIGRVGEGNAVDAGTLGRRGTRFALCHGFRRGRFCGAFRLALSLAESGGVLRNGDLGEDHSVEVLLELPV